MLLDLDSTTMQSKTGVFTKETLEWFEQFKKHFLSTIFLRFKRFDGYGYA